MADSLRGAGTGWRFGTGCPAGRPVGDAGVGYRQPGPNGTGRCPVLRSGIWRRRHLTGGEGGFNLAQPPEVRLHFPWEVHERDHRPGRTFLPGPPQGLPHLPAGDGEWRMVSGEWKITPRYSLLVRATGRSPLPLAMSTSQP